MGIGDGGDPAAEGRSAKADIGLIGNEGCHRLWCCWDWVEGAAGALGGEGSEVRPIRAPGRSRLLG